MIRVRFAPSPTGYLHVGNARTALFNYLFARGNNGSFILRIEDTDIARSKEDYCARIMDDLRWLGLEWDEGPEIGGPHAPYRQSERLSIYKDFADKLLREDKAYHCYCSDRELKVRRDEALKSGRTPRYDNRCRSLSEKEIENFKKRRIRPVVRFKVPVKTMTVNDIVRGRVDFDTSLIGDFVIMKSTATPSFNFAVVCDDITMEVTHVIRGEDHLPNTPKHALLFEALGFNLPAYAHMSLTTAPGGERLSKRTGATSIAYYREMGYLPEAMVNYLALLGWSPGGDKEVMSIDELIKEFSLEKLSRSSEAFDPGKLDWLNGIYIRKKDPDALARMCVPYLKRARFIKKDALTGTEFERLKDIVEAVRDHLANLSQINSHVSVFFKDKVVPREDEAKRIVRGEPAKKVLRAFFEKLKKADTLDEDTFNAITRDIERDTRVKGKDLYQPIRIALTGELHGPELKIIVPIIGKTNCITRIKRVLRRI